MEMDNDYKNKSLKATFSLISVLMLLPLLNKTNINSFYITAFALLASKDIDFLANDSSNKRLFFRLCDFINQYITSIAIAFSCVLLVSDFKKMLGTKWNNIVAYIIFAIIISITTEEFIELACWGYQYKIKVSKINKAKENINKEKGE